MRKIDLDLDEIARLLKDEQLTQTEVAERFGCCVSVIQKRMKAYGLRLTPGSKKGSRHRDWKGGRRLVGGYVYIYHPEHPRATKQGYVLEHRLVMEGRLGRYLEPEEVVHHVNADRQDNRIENLAVFANNAEHLREELTGRVPNWSEEGKERIREASRRKGKNYHQKHGGHS